MNVLSSCRALGDVRLRRAVSPSAAGHQVGFLRRAPPGALVGPAGEAEELLPCRALNGPLFAPRSSYGCEGGSRASTRPWLYAPPGLARTSRGHPR